MGQRGNPHGHPLALLGFGRAGGGEADADHLMDRSKEAKLGKTLKVSAGNEGKGRGYDCFTTTLAVKKNLFLFSVGIQICLLGTSTYIS